MILRTRTQRIFLAAALLICAPARGFAITAAQWQSDLQFLVSHLRGTLGNSLVEVIHRRVEILRAHVEVQVRVG